MQEHCHDASGFHDTSVVRPGRALMTDDAPSNSSTSSKPDRVKKPTSDAQASTSANNLGALHRLLTRSSICGVMTGHGISNGEGAKRLAPLADIAKAGHSGPRAPRAEVQQSPDITSIDHERNRAGGLSVSRPRRVLRARGHQNQINPQVSFYQPRWDQDLGTDRFGELHNMGDVDYKGDYGRDRGGHGGRKRRYREDDDYDRRPQRRRYEELPSHRLRKQLLSLAESPLKRPDEEVTAISQAIQENYDDVYFRNDILELITQIIVEQPFKIPFIAAVMVEVNSSKPDFVKTALDKSGMMLQEYLETGQWRLCKLVLRFFACIQSVLDSEGLFDMLDELFNRAVDLQAASSRDALGLELVKIIMLTLPYAIAYSDGCEEKVAKLLEKTELIASAPHELITLVDPYVRAAEGTPLARSSLHLLQNHLQSEKNNSWTLSFFPKLGKTIAKQDDATGDTKEVKKHRFPALNVPETINPGHRPIFPEVYFSLYADQDIETVPPTTSLAASLFRDTLVDTINLIDFNRGAAARILIDIDCYWAPNTFVKRATPFDRLKEVAGQRSSWKPEDMAVDAIFSQMLVVPFPEHKLVFYHSMITETCKIAPAAIAPSLGRAIRFLYRNCDVLDLELNNRFLDWFAHHLSNFDFRWKWTEWVDDVSLSRLSSKKTLILGALDKEVRLSFAKRIRDTLPEPYHSLIPASRDNDIPEFKYNNALTPFSDEGKQILVLLRRKAPEVEIQAVFDKIHASNDSSIDPNVASTDAYVTTICYIGSKSLSHVLSYIERCKERLLLIAASSPAARLQIVASVIAYWRAVQPGVAVNIVDKLLNYTVLDPGTVVTWALADSALVGADPSDPQACALATTWIYEMVARTVAKVTTRLRQIVAARMQKDQSQEQINALDETLARDRESMKALFATIEDAVVSVASGDNDRMMEMTEMDETQQELLRQWGMKWLRTFRRKYAVEDSIIEDAVKLFPPASAANGGPTTDGNTANGHVDGNEGI